VRLSERLVCRFMCTYAATGGMRTTLSDSSVRAAVRHVVASGEPFRVCIAIAHFPRAFTGHRERHRRLHCSGCRDDAMRGLRWRLRDGEEPVQRNAELVHLGRECDNHICLSELPRVFSD
jgi:hypothetical protein